MSPTDPDRLRGTSTPRSHRIRLYPLPLPNNTAMTSSQPAGERAARLREEKADTCDASHRKCCLSLRSSIIARPCTLFPGWFRPKAHLHHRRVPGEHLPWRRRAATLHNTCTSNNKTDLLGTNHTVQLPTPRESPPEHRRRAVAERNRELECLAKMRHANKCPRGKAKGPAHFHMAQDSQRMNGYFKLARVATSGHLRRRFCVCSARSGGPGSEGRLRALYEPSVTEVCRQTRRRHIDLCRMNGVSCDNNYLDVWWTARRIALSRGSYPRQDQAASGSSTKRKGPIISTSLAVF